MKKILFLLLALMILPMSVLGAGTIPTQLGDFTVTPTAGFTMGVEGGNEGEPNFAVWNNYVAYIEDQPSTQPTTATTTLKIYNYLTDTIVYSDTLYTTGCCNGISSAIGLEYDKGYLLAGGQGAPPSGGNNKIYDVSNIAFVSVTASGSSGTFNSHLDILQNTGGGVFYVDAGSDRILKFNASGVFDEGASQGQKQAIDQDNYVWSVGNSLYDYENSWSAPTLLHTMGGGEGNFDDWNRNPVNPEYISTTGHITLTGGASYTNIQTASIGITEIYPEISSPFLFFERDNIIARNTTSGNLVTIDATDIFAPVVVDTGISSQGNKYYREKDNTFFTYNTSSQTAYIYETEEVEITLPDESIDTPPTVEADFLGVDIAGDFVFQTTMTDPNEGRVYLSQSLYEASVEPSESFTILEEVDFSTLNVLNQIDDLKGSTTRLISSVDYLNHTPIFDNSLELRPQYNELIEVYFNDVATQQEGDIVTYDLLFSANDVSPFLGIDQDFELSAISSTGTEFFKYKFAMDYTGVDDIVIEEYTGAYSTIFSGNTYDQNGNIDIISINAVINFSSQTSDITIRGFNQTYYNATVPFIESVTSLAGTRFNLLDGQFDEDYRYHFGYMGYEQDTSIQNTLDYVLFENLEAGESIVKATRQEGNFEFGDYSLYSYGTDDVFGFSYVDSSDIETFTYSEDTEVLTEDEIQNLIAGLQTGLDTGLADFVEGDLFTDTFANAIEGAGFKSTASKLFLAVVLILVFVASGYTYGAIGSVIGGIGGLVLAMFLGWIPVWIVVTLVLGLIAVASFEARKLIAGGR